VRGEIRLRQRGRIIFRLYIEFRGVLCQDGVASLPGQRDDRFDQVDNIHVESPCRISEAAQYKTLR